MSVTRDLTPLGILILVATAFVGVALVRTEPGGVRRARKQNRLASEKSPYLLQHASNPVDWYPWGPEAFETAREEDRPIFLSIGYSTCHWCHVMEKESFEDPEVAALMNETFVCIKVDREERPDIDKTYMEVAMLMSGAGGWPLAIIMTPEKRPFFASTYIPKETRFGREGMMTLVPKIGGLWKNRRSELVDVSERVVEAIVNASEESGEVELGEDALEAAFRQLADKFDSEQGGFGVAPKFPTPHNLTFLLRYWRRTGSDQARHMVEETLRAMRRGGVYDHVGHGFHRYSTDRTWTVPHFEKMLYDQAMLAIAYVDAHQATSEAEYAQTAREIFGYVLRDMTDPGGAFYSAEDADSEGVEGKFYVWTSSEVDEILTPDEVDLARDAYSLSEDGNFVDEATGSRDGSNILRMGRSPHELASAHGLTETEAADRLESIRAKLFAARERRVHPHKDDKILTDWNGLMIAALARGSRVLAEPAYAEAARRAADFVLREMRTGDRLVHRYRDGEAGLPATVDDYAFLIWGLLELYETTFDVGRLKTALALNSRLVVDFWDEERGGFYFSPDYGETLLTRQREIYDGAVPSGNSVAMMNLLRLSRMTGDPTLEDQAAAISRAFAVAVRRFPMGYTELLSAVGFGLGPSHEVVIVGDPDAPDTRAMLDALRSRFLPNKVVLIRPVGESEMTEVAPYTSLLASADGGATAYVCRGFRCELPTTDPDHMLQQLEGP